MHMIGVNSDNVHSIGYDSDHEGVYIRYSNGDTFAYFGVPYHLFNKIRRSTHLTRLINKELKGQFQIMKVTP